MKKSKPHLILEDKINQFMKNKNIGKLVLYTIPCKSNNYLIKEKDNIQGVLHPLGEPDNLYNFILHMNREYDCESLTLLKHGVYE